MLRNYTVSSSKPSFVDATGLLLESGRKRGGRFVASSAAAFLLTAAAVAKANCFFLTAVALATVPADLKALPHLLQLDAKMLTTAPHGHVFFVARFLFLPMASPGPRP